MALALTCSGVGMAGGRQPEAAWLGRAVDVQNTEFCRANGCRLLPARQNQTNTVGWHDGQQLRYGVGQGWTLEVEVRPEGWISNAFLLNSSAHRGTRLDTKELNRAAHFLSAVTGRQFSAGAVRSCISAGLAAQNLDPDIYGPLQQLSQWKTPAGLPYKARCGVAGAGPLGVWAGWMQA
ncbi:hypothetical protein [Deinococcus marmoris]|uniref:hypothetical protein n=1 Tax=Deinococcus marmoris TaxID=249408 RepID=UPI00049615F9|nr:hypothetical protein [Deinococcus marmoris]